MRVLHVHSGNIFGGIETALVTIARERQRRAQGEMYAALCSGGRLADALLSAGVGVSMLGDARLSRPARARGPRGRLAGLLDQVQPDLVMMHLPWTQVIFGGVVKRHGHPLVVWMHGPSAGWLSRAAALRRPDAIICNSAYTASSIPRTHRSIPRAIIRYPSAPPDANARAARSAVRRELETDESKIAIVQVSRLDPWKGHELLLRAAGRMRDLPGWVLWLVGGPQRPVEAAYEKTLRALTVELGIGERVKFVGQRSDVPNVLAAADVYCQPNTQPEPFGLSYVEALAAGLPVVASNSGGATEIVTPNTGILVRPCDAGDLEAALRRLVRDPVERARLGANGPARAAELCDPERQLRRIEEFLEQAVARRPLANH